MSESFNSLNIKVNTGNESPKYNVYHWKIIVAAVTTVVGARRAVTIAAAASVPMAMLFSLFIHR